MQKGCPPIGQPFMRVSSTPALGIGHMGVPDLVSLTEVLGPHQEVSRETGL